MADIEARHSGRAVSIPGPGRSTVVRPIHGRQLCRPDWQARRSGSGSRRTPARSPITSVAAVDAFPPRDCRATRSIRLRFFALSGSGIICMSAFAAAALLWLGAHGYQLAVGAVATLTRTKACMAVLGEARRTSPLAAGALPRPSTRTLAQLLAELVYPHRPRGRRIASTRLLAAQGGGRGFRLRSRALLPGSAGAHPGHRPRRGDRTGAAGTSLTMLPEPATPAVQPEDQYREEAGYDYRRCT